MLHPGKWYGILQNMQLSLDAGFMIKQNETYGFFHDKKVNI